ncbi:ATP-dependent Clp protease proteolytic subunit [Afipia sp. 1NLS2]|uniref:ATP-dependent Clp protease proteolytic subunit n=1 Tax=Afipia sp. 1NLS2 TaxID=666684 RepID=UPI0001DA0790|nr:ATP-dependent Clp protease proteolytic subunit [Afipia sp. 1NLS2]EFI52018.1 peptidase S14 ClpP [Afipia sp. 1NLS2]
MSEPQPAEDIVPPNIYGLFAGFIDQQAVMRFHNAISVATNAGVKRIHLLFQTTGGGIGEGISLYNLFRSSPVEIHLYNVGSVSSIGVIAYLGATRRIASKHSAFMIHRSYLSPVAANADRMAASAEYLAIEDTRTESILKEHTKIPPTKWEQHKFSDVWISSEEAKSFGIAEEIGEFSPQAGAKLFNVWPPQN